MQIVYPTVGTTAFGGRPLIGIFPTIEFWRALNLKTGSYNSVEYN